MKIFENIAEYKAFKKQYELMGALETDRLNESAKDEMSLQKFLLFMDDVLRLPVETIMKEKIHDDEFQSDIERQQFFLHFLLHK